MYKYKSFNESVGFYAIIIYNGKLICGRITINYPISQEVIIMSNLGQHRCKEREIVGVIKFDISDYGSIDIMETDCCAAE